MVGGIVDGVGDSVGDVDVGSYFNDNTAGDSCRDNSGTMNLIELSNIEPMSFLLMQRRLLHGLKGSMDVYPNFIHLSPPLTAILKPLNPPY